jgi:hypothetical protein
MTALISSCFSVLPHEGIRADFPTALPPRAIVLLRVSSLKEFNTAPSLASGGMGLRFDRLEGPAGVESAWHQTQY